MTSKSPALPLFLLFLLAVAPIFRLASNGFTLFPQVIPSHLDFVHYVRWSPAGAGHFSGTRRGGARLMGFGMGEKNPVSAVFKSPVGWWIFHPGVFLIPIYHGNPWNNPSLIRVESHGESIFGCENTRNRRNDDRMWRLHVADPHGNWIENDE